MSGSLSTFSKLDNLLRTTNLNATRFSALCRLSDIKGMSDASLNRAIQRKSFPAEVDQAVRPLITQIEDLIERMKPVPVSFDNVEHIHSILELIEGGVNLLIDVETNSNKQQ